MEQQWNPSARPWYLDREGSPLPMDQMGPMLYDGSFEQAGRMGYASYGGIWLGTADDSQYLQELTQWQRYYPEKMKKLQKYVEEACDRLDYKGSMLYDEQPDTLAVEQLMDAIYRRIRQDEEFAAEFVFEEDAVELYETVNEAAEVHATAIMGPGCPEGRGCPGGHRHPPRPPFPPGPPFPPPPPPPYPERRPEHNWIQDIIPVLLFQEVFKRRSHHRGHCRYCY